MNERQIIKQALRKADAAGNTADATRLAAAYRALGSEEQSAQEQPSIEQQRENIADGMTLNIAGWDTGVKMPQGVTEFLAGAGRRLNDIGTLGTAERTPEADRLLDDSGYATAGSIGADILGSLAVGGGLGVLGTKLAATAPRVGSALQGAGNALIGKHAKTDQLGMTVAKMAAAGAAYGGATEQNRLAGAAGGGIGGGIGAVAPRALNKIIGGFSMDEGAEKLINRGVKDLTTGQRWSPGAAMVEEKLMSLPFVGGGIAAARRRGFDSYNNMVFNEALAPLQKIQKDMPMDAVTPINVGPGNNSVGGFGPNALPAPEATPNLPQVMEAGGMPSVNVRTSGGVVDDVKAPKFYKGHTDQIGSKAYADAKRQTSEVYEDLLSNMPVVRDAEFDKTIDLLRQMGDQLPAQESRKFNQILDEHLLKGFDNPNNLMLAETFKKAYSGLGEQATKFGKNQSTYVNDLGDAVSAARDTLFGLVERQHPNRAAALKQADTAYARVSVLGEAADPRGAKNGVFTPAGHYGAIHKLTPKEVRKKNLGFGQQAAADADVVLGHKVPDSGTAGRLLGATAVGAGFVTPGSTAMTALAMGALRAGSTRPMQKAINSLLFARPEIRKSIGGVFEGPPSKHFTGLLGGATGREYSQ